MRSVDSSVADADAALYTSTPRFLSASSPARVPVPNGCRLGGSAASYLAAAAVKEASAVALSLCVPRQPQCVKCVLFIK